MFVLLQRYLHQENVDKEFHEISRIVSVHRLECYHYVLNDWQEELILSNHEVWCLICFRVKGFNYYIVNPSIHVISCWAWNAFFVIVECMLTRELWLYTSNKYSKKYKMQMTRQHTPDRPTGQLQWPFCANPEWNFSIAGLDTFSYDFLICALTKVASSSNKTFTKTILRRTKSLWAFSCCPRETWHFLLHYFWNIAFVTFG